MLAIRLLLAAVFLLAGLAKLANRNGSRQALIDFGIPGILASPLGILLPLAELAVAAALLPVASAWFGAVGAVSLLLLFILGIAINLALGRSPNCRCFGQLSSTPVGWSTLSRNAGLAAIAGFVVWRRENPGPSVVGWVGDLGTAQRVLLVCGVAALALLAGQVGLLLQILRQQGRLLLRFDALEARLASGGMVNQPTQVPVAPTMGLPVGSPAPGFRLKGLRGESLTLEALLAASKPLLLLFSHPNCGPCQALMSEMHDWQRDYAAKLNVAIVSEGSARANRLKATEHALTQVLLQKKREVAEAYQAYGTPGAVLVHPDGSIASSVAQGADAVRALVVQAAGLAMPAVPVSVPVAPGNGRGAGAMTSAPAVRLGQEAPPLSFPDLNGKTVALSSFRGGSTLLLFWNPGCGFCQQMLNDLRAWELNPPPEAPRLLVISTGSTEDNRAMGLRSPIVLDHNSQAGTALGAGGTHMAVLLDAKGRVASEVVAGAQSVLQLARVELKEQRAASWPSR